MCNEIINSADNVSTNVTNTKSANAMITVQTDSDNEKVKYKLD